MNENWGSGGVGGGLDFVLEGHSLGRVRQIGAATVDVEFPAVINAAEAVVLVAAKEEVGAAVRTVGFEDADAAAGVFEADEIFAKDSKANGSAIRRGQFLGKQDRQPEAAKELAHRRSRPCSGQQFVVFLGEHRSSPCALGERFGLPPRGLGSPSAAPI
jgi:hypothetical protein